MKTNSRELLLKQKLNRLFKKNRMISQWIKENKYYSDGLIYM
jgi:ribosomal protein L39E